MGEDRVTGTVKFFDRGRGFGFVALESGGDAFLHASALEAAGLPFPQEGDAVLGRVETGPRGAQMVDLARPPRAAEAPRPGGSEGTPALGTVKWFDPAKGFGFVAVDDGGADAILHRSVLDRARLPALDEGQRVLVLVAERAKGREILTLATVDAPTEAARARPRLHEVRRPFDSERNREGARPERRAPFRRRDGS